MRFRVPWAPFAEESLERLLQGSAEAAELAAAAREIDRHLHLAPIAFGESRFDDVRIAFVYPLGIQFEVMEDVQTVVEYDVWRVDRK